MPGRFFNTTGPVEPAEHYFVPPLDRIRLDEVLTLIRARRYFVLHAPRQTGKTSVLLALRDRLNATDNYRCVYANVEVGQSRHQPVAAGVQAVLSAISLEARLTLDDHWPDSVLESMLSIDGPMMAFNALLSEWAIQDPRPLVLLLDEIDALAGDTLLTVLRQLRAGFHRRPGKFPSSVILCGVRDVRDYQIHSEESGTSVTGGSAFNIKAESLRLGDFDAQQVRALLAQHTAETGQAFAEEAVSEVWRQSCGQPWLVNALAHQACFRNPSGRDRTRTIDAEAILEAREELVQGRQTHLRQLTERLHEPRVRRVIGPILSGQRDHASRPDDVEYARDLGLIALQPPRKIANPVYREVIPRALLHAREEEIPHETEWYVRKDGGLDLGRLLAAFQEFYREHSEHWIERFEYREAGPQLLLQAFLQRIVNGGGRIEREYGLGRGRTDLLIVWPSRSCPDAPESHVAPSKHVIECKIKRGGMEATLRSGVEQTLEYLDRCGADSAHLVVFDRDPEKTWEEKLFTREESRDGRKVCVWGA